MKIKKIVALLLCAALLAAVLTGCKQTAKSPFVSSDPTGTASPSISSPEASASPSAQAEALNFAGAYASLDPKTVMLTINGSDVTWDVFFYYIYYVINQIQSQGNEITDMSAPYQDETSYKDYILNAATNLALQYAALNYGASQLNVSLSDSDKAAVQADWDSRVSSAESEDNLNAQLKANFCSKDLLMTLVGFSYLAQDCFDSMYGTDGSKLSDQDVADYTAADGYLMAKHILFMTSVPDESGNTTPMSDADKAKVREKAEGVLTQLKNYKGNDFNGYFDQLMNQYSEDKGGLSSYPDGYLFQDGDMYAEFEAGTKALEVGKFSQELVETKAGYHIIYRIPINYDIVPIANSNSGNTASLRLLTAQKMFSAVADSWMSSLNVVQSDKYKALDFSKIFAAE